MFITGYMGKWGFFKSLVQNLQTNAKPHNKQQKQQRVAKKSDLVELGCRDPSWVVIHKNVDVQNINRVSLGTLRFLERLCTHLENYKNQVLKTAQNHAAKYPQKAHFEHFRAPSGEGVITGCFRLPK